MASVNQNNPQGATNEGWPTTVTTNSASEVVVFTAYTGNDVTLGSIPSTWSNKQNNGRSAQATAGAAGTWDISASSASPEDTPGTTLTISSGG